MRPDIKEVLITRGRVGSGYARNGTVRRIRRTKIEEDDAAFPVKMRPENQDSAWNKKCHNLGEHLKPLERYLNSQVGLPWDDIYSEICKNNPKNSAIGAHIYEHLFFFVEVNVVYLEDGTPCRPNSLDWPLWRDQLYVDDKGILRRVLKKREQKPASNNNVRWVAPYTYVVKNNNNIWFEFKYSNHFTTTKVFTEITNRNKELGILEPKKVETTTVEPTFQEKYPNKTFSDLPQLGRGNESYLIGIRTLSKKEKKKYGLD